MSKFVCITGATPFRLSDDRSSDAIRELAHEHMDGYPVNLELIEPHPDGDLYGLEMKGEEVGESFATRLKGLVSAMGPHVLDAFSVVIREDLMSDDRDQTLYGGPDSGSIQDFRIKAMVGEAKDLLNDVQVRAALLRDLLADPELAGVVPSTPSVFVTIDGGVLQSVVSSHELFCTKIDYDAKDCDLSDLVPVSQGYGPDVLACVEDVFVEVSPERCKQLAGIASQGPPRPDLLLGFSADGYWSNDLGWVESAADATPFGLSDRSSLDLLVGHGVCVLTVDPLMKSVLPSMMDLEARVDAFLAQVNERPTAEDKADWLKYLRGEFPTLGDDYGAFAPAVLSLLGREEENRRRSEQRPHPA